jgi:uncharacterized membrane protein YgcG
VNNIFSSPVGLSQLDPPASKRSAFPLATNNGSGAGNDGSINFVTGAEVFQFTSESIQGPRKPAAISSMWVDASNLAAGKTLTIQASNGQKFVVAGGTQGYYIIPLPAPFILTIMTNAGAAVSVNVTLYNYNVAFTGFESQSASSAAKAATGGGTGNGGTGGGGTGGSGGSGGKGGFL